MREKNAVCNISPDSFIGWEKIYWSLWTEIRQTEKKYL